MRNKYILLLIIVLLGGFLRLYKLDKVPPGLYLDEIAIGYNAYTISKSGVDQYGKKLPFVFYSYGDNKLPGYIYLDALFIKLLGRNDLAVRLPSAISGTLSIISIFFLLKYLVELDKKNKYSSKLPLVGAFLFAILPWSIQFSRAGFETNLALFFYITGLALVLSFLKKKNALVLVLGLVSLVLTIYIYQAYRVTTPLTLAGIGIYLFFREIKERKKIILAFIFAFVLTLPMIVFSLSPAGHRRFSQTSAFLFYEDKSFQEKIKLFPMLVVRNYVSYYSPEFLFVAGDGFGRHQIPGFGPVFRSLIPLILIGLYFLLGSAGSITKKFTFFLLMLAPIAPAFTIPSPHTLRSMPMMIPVIILSALGIEYLIKRKTRTDELFLIVISLAIAFEFCFFLSSYFFKYPYFNIFDWGSGYKEIVLDAKSISKNYDKIVIDKNLEFAPLYFEFYAPGLKYQMVPVTWQKQKEWASKKVLYIRPNYHYTREQAPEIFHSIFLDDKDKTVAAQFWNL